MTLAWLFLKELSAFGGFGDGLIRGLRQPEYLHVLLNPLPVYGLLISWIGLIAALISKSRRAQIVDVNSRIHHLPFRMANL